MSGSQNTPPPAPQGEESKRDKRELRRVQGTQFPMSTDGEEMKGEEYKGMKAPNARTQGNV